jgi:plasmid stabilization system protein ParE
MRRVVYAATFLAEADAIADYVESRFGRLRTEQFRSDLERFCEALADTPGRGKSDHGYRTPLLGVVFEYDWIFFRIDEDTAHFVHIVRSRRLKSAIRF